MLSEDSKTGTTGLAGNSEYCVFSYLVWGDYQVSKILVDVVNQETDGIFSNLSLRKNSRKIRGWCEWHQRVCQVLPFKATTSSFEWCWTSKKYKASIPVSQTFPLVRWWVFDRQVVGTNLEKLVSRAREAKTKMGDEFIATEHLVLGMADDPRIGQSLFKAFGTSKGRLNSSIEEIRGGRKVWIHR